MTQDKGRVAAVATTIAIATILGIQFGTFSASRAEARPAAIYVPFAPEGSGCGICDVCFMDDHVTFGHVTAPSTEGLARLGPEGRTHSDCELGDCLHQHPYDLENCPSGDGETVSARPATATPSLPELWDSFRDARGSELKRLLAENPEHAEYNAMRSAIQFIGCNDHPVAQLPLSDEQLADLN